MRRSRKNRCGQALVEFTFVGIPLIFVLISTFEISRGMWMYQTLAYAVKEGVRYAVVHGANCGTNGNTCQVAMGPATSTCSTDSTINPTIAEVIRCAGIGLDPTKTKVTFTSLTGTVGPCTLETSGTNACGTATWPPVGGNQINDPITIKITTPFTSAIAMLWPGAKPVSFAAGTLGAQSSDNVQY
jgi:Flp pilus assembly protein TadG